MIRLALTDLDDTLVAFGSPCANERSRAAFHAMAAAGLRTGPVSGRIPGAMSWMFDDDEACYATGALVNGQMVYLDGELIHTEAMDAAVLERAIDVCDDTGSAMLVVHRLDLDDGGLIVTRKPRQARRLMDDLAGTGFGRGERSPHMEPSLAKPRYVKANIRVVGTPERRVEVRDHLRAECPELDFVFPNPRAPLIDISPAGWDKGSAVRLLADELGLGLDEVVVFGDSENDLSMMLAVPNSVAVANAVDEVCHAARWHIGRCAEDAVAKALEDIAAAAPRGEMPAFMSGGRTEWRGAHERTRRHTAGSQ